MVGARPNFMKVAPIVRALKARGTAFEPILVHTGQHYDDLLSSSFFRDLRMPAPDVNLEVGSGSHAEQTARVLMAFEPVCREYAPDIVLVVGDVNSTLACALTAKKLGIDVAHVEAGLRSGDREMPEEINRLCTDAISDHLFTTDRLADENLRNEGIPESKIHFAGNVMIDTLLSFKEQAAELQHHRLLGLKDRGYATLTLHRPSNVDNQDTLRRILGALRQISEDVPIVFPAHPRTRSMILKFGLGDHFSSGRIRMIDPLGYLEFLSLNSHARMVLTDSGGIQEETTILGVPCITLRDNTERPITLAAGTNTLVGTDPEKIIAAFQKAHAAEGYSAAIPEKWDGKAAERIVDTLADLYFLPDLQLQAPR